MHASKRKDSAHGVIIMAAGYGKRMHSSSTPKVLKEIGGEPLLFHILDSATKAFSDVSFGIIVGHGREQVEKAVSESPRFQKMKISFIHQPEPLGTGHAVRCAVESPWGEELIRARAPILVLPGDLPLIPETLIKEMCEKMGSHTALRLLTCELPDPSGYGRVVRRGKKGDVLRIVEERDANDREKAIHEVAASIYFFNSQFLKAGLRRLSTSNAQGEYYLTDLIAQAIQAKKKVEVLVWEKHEDILGVNNPWELAQVGRMFNERCIKEWALKGVQFMDPTSTWVEASVTLDEDVIIYPGVMLSGQTVISRGVVLRNNVLLKNVQVGEGAVIKAGTVAEDSLIGPGAQIGPYAHFRPGSSVGKNSKIGNFVELKKTSIGEKTNVAHLSYLGDAQVGSGVNIGCGFVTCNFDGRIIDGKRKHETIIEDNVFVGSDCQTVAPVRIGAGAYVASGSTITEDVEPGSLALSRTKQINKSGYASKLRSTEKDK